MLHDPHRLRDSRGLCRDGRLLKQFCQLDVALKLPLRGGMQLDHQHRMATDIKEIVVQQNAAGSLILEFGI